MAASNAVNKVTSQENVHQVVAAVEEEVVHVVAEAVLAIEAAVDEAVREVDLGARKETSEGTVDLQQKKLNSMIK